MKIIELESVDSTNNYAKRYLQNYKHQEDTLIFSHSQTQGRGNANNSWHTEPNKNIILSLVLFPNIDIKKNFYISISVSLSILEFLDLKKISAKIKWPNDIYVEDKKISGILIENTINNNIITDSIIGIGLNLNQTEFSNSLPNPISVKNIINKDSNLNDDIFSLTNIIITNIKKKFLYDKIKEKYLKNLYRFQIFANFQINDEIIIGKIIDIDNFGQIIIELAKGERKKFAFKEIKFK